MLAAYTACQRCGDDESVIDQETGLCHDCYYHKGDTMTPKPCSICGSIEYTRSYVTKDGKRVCDMHGEHSAFEALCRAVGVKPQEFGKPSIKECVGGCGQHSCGQGRYVCDGDYCNHCPARLVEND